MSRISIKRSHQLGLEKARQLAKQWQQDGEADYHLACEYVGSDTEDCIRFRRSGVTGELRVTEISFELDAHLGFLLSAFKERIEREIHTSLDALLLDALLLDPLLLDASPNEQ